MSDSFLPRSYPAVPGASESSFIFSLLLVGSSPLLVKPVVEVLRKEDVDFVYTYVESLEGTESQEQGQSYDAVLFLDALEPTDSPANGLAHTLAVIQKPNRTVPMVWVVNDAREEQAIAALEAGLSTYVRQSKLSSLPVVLRWALRQYATGQTSQAKARQLQQQKQQEHLIQTLLQTIGKTLNYEDVLQIALDELHQTFGVDRCLMFTEEETGDRRFRVASAATPDRDRILRGEMPCEIRATDLAQLQQGNPVLFHAEIDATPDTFRQHMEAWPVKTSLILPLICHRQYRGGLMLHTCKATRQWDVDEIEDLRRVSEPCAIALHQTQLLKTIQRQAKEKALLHHISHILNSSLELPFALQEILRFVGEELEGDRVVLYRAGSDVICLQAEWCRNADVPSLQGRTMTTPNWMGELVFADNGEPLSNARPSPVPLQPLAASLPELASFNTGTMLAVPILIRSSFYGGLELHLVSEESTSLAPQNHRFTTEDINLFQRIADQIAIALHSIKSYENLEYIIQERTQQLEAEKQISESANLAKSEFLAHMSHELRTPLTGIIGFSNVLSNQMQNLLTPQQTKYLEGITACGQHLLDMINDLLDLSKVEAGKEELFLEPVVIQEICDACLNMFQEAASSKKLSG